MLEGPALKSRTRFCCLSLLLTLALSACSTTGVLPLTESMDTVARTIDELGPSATVTLHARVYSAESDTSSAHRLVRERFAQADAETQFINATLHHPAYSGQPFEAFARTTTVPWEDVLGVSVSEKNHGKGLIEGLAYGALVGGAVGAAVGAATYQPCEAWCILHPESRGSAAGAGFAAGGVLGGLVGALIGGATGSRRTTTWRR